MTTTYYTLTNPTAGNPTLVNVLNQLAIDIERLNDEFALYNSIYYSNAPITIPASSTSYIISFAQSAGSALIYDDLQMMDKVNFNKFTVPYGFSYARLTLELEFKDTAGAGQLAYCLSKNGSVTFTGNFFKGQLETTTGSAQITQTPWISVNAGDTFQVLADNINATFSVTTSVTRAFAMELKK